ncbi:MAG: WbqC family protein [Saprospiraceae bacterium]
MAHPLTVAIHQPNYFPWLGYFYKIYAADVFVFLDDVQYTRRSPTARTDIIKRHGEKFRHCLSVPLLSHGYYENINNLKIHSSKGWQRKHLETIRHTYSSTPHFQEYFPQASTWISDADKFDFLSDYNIYLIKSILEILKINKPAYKSSQLSVKGHKSEYIISLVKHLGGTTYLSGTGARKYQREDDFSRRGIQLVYSDFGDWLEKHPYPQFQGTEFVNGLSIVDALFNAGAEGVMEMFERYDKSERGK